MRPRRSRAKPSSPRVSARYMSFGDGEAAAETYCYAADKENAKLAFDAMSYGMFYEGNPFEEKGCRPLAREIKTTAPTASSA